MANTKGVVRAFFALGKRGHTLPLADGVHPVAPTGKNFMGIGLMPHIPHQTIFWRVVEVVQGDGEFHRTQAGGEMAAALADRIQQVSAKFARHLFQRRFW